MFYHPTLDKRPSRSSACVKSTQCSSANPDSDPDESGARATLLARRKELSATVGAVSVRVSKRVLAVGVGIVKHRIATAKHCCAILIALCSICDALICLITPPTDHCAPHSDSFSYRVLSPVTSLSSARLLTSKTSNCTRLV